MNDRYLTTSEAAAYLRLHAKTVQRMARAGEIRHVRIGRRFLFKRTWLDEACESTFVTTGGSND